MEQDNVKVLNAINKVNAYLWEDEMLDFQSTYELTISSQDNLEEWIKWCEDNFNEVERHIFYYLMIIKNSYLEEVNS